MKSKYLSMYILLLFSSMLFSQEGSSHSLLKIGASKNLNGVEYKLIEAKKVESNIHLKIEVKNIDRKNFNYSALLFHKLYNSKGQQIANIDPFLSKKSVVFDVKKGQSFISNLVYEVIDIDEPLQLSIVKGANPQLKAEGLIFTCKSSLSKDEIYFDLSQIKLTSLKPQSIIRPVILNPEKSRSTCPAPKLRFKSVDIFFGIKKLII